jgi:hypothetical protein
MSERVFLHVPPTDARALSTFWCSTIRELQQLQSQQLSATGQLAKGLDWMASLQTWAQGLPQFLLFAQQLRILLRVVDWLSLLLLKLHHRACQAPLNWCLERRWTWSQHLKRLIHCWVFGGVIETLANAKNIL